MIRFYLDPKSGVQKPGTPDVRQNTCGWTKWDLDEQIIGHIMKEQICFVLLLTNLTFGSLSKDINTFSNEYCKNCPMSIE